MASVSYCDRGAVIGASPPDLPSIVVVAVDVKDFVTLDTENTAVKYNKYNV